MSPRLLFVAAVAAVASCSPGTRGAQMGSPPASSAPATSVRFSAVTFDQGPCFGTCPSYRVTIGGDGAVAFEGRAYVDSMRGAARLPAIELRALDRAFEEHGFFAMDTQYVRGAPSCGVYAADAPTVITSYSSPGRSRRIVHSRGCANAPVALERLEARIAEIAGISRWTGKR